jgi:mRNA interferase MazF
MITSQLAQQVEGFDEVLEPSDSDFRVSGLKAPSVVRLARLAVVERGLAAGVLGEVSPERLARARSRLAAWLGGTATTPPV